MASMKGIVRRTRTPGRAPHAIRLAAPIRASLGHRRARRSQRDAILRASIVLAVMGGTAAASLLAAVVVRRLMSQITQEEIEAVVEPIGTLPDEEQVLAALEAVSIAEGS